MFYQPNSEKIIQQIQGWALTDPDLQRLVKTSVERSGGTFRYINQVYKWVKKEVEHFSILEASVRNRLESLDEEETRSLPQGRDNALINIVRGLQELETVFQATLGKLKFIRRKRLVESVEFHKNSWTYT